MSVETNIYSTLTADATVRSYVSSGSPLVHRVYQAFAPDGTAEPFLTFNIISHTSYNKLAAAPDMHRKLVQISAWSRDLDEAANLAEAARAALDQIGHMTAGRVLYTPDTQRHHVAFDFAFIDAY